MLLELILLAIIVFLSLWIIKLKAQLGHVYKSLSNDKIANNKEVPSIDMETFNSNFSKVLLDPLTDLPGHEAFKDRLMQTINQSSRFETTFAIMLFDIDDFQKINQEHSYEIGDKIIIEISKRLKKVIRQIDTLTRFAGGQFTVLLPQLVSPETAAYVAQRLLDSVLIPFIIDDKNIVLTGSVGVAIYPSDGHDAQTLLHNANDALQRAKALGKGHFKFYHEEMHALGQRELSMHAALSKDDFLTDMAILYQPQINTKTGEIIAVQASPILKLPEYGEINFGDFARIAVNCKKDLELWEWLLRHSVMQLQKWRNKGLKLNNLIIDVTYNQIQDPQFIYKITQILQEFTLQPNELIFEIVEKNLTNNNNDSIVKSFTTLKNIQIQLALSVFALGRLALHKITQLPVTYLKIDAQIIQENKDLNEYENILQTLISLAKEMNINIVAEGVENNYQKELLESFGCTIMQGKLFSEKIPTN